MDNNSCPAMRLRRKYQCYRDGLGTGRLFHTPGAASRGNTGVPEARSSTFDHLLFSCSSLGCLGGAICHYTELCLRGAN